MNSIEIFRNRVDELERQLAAEKLARETTERVRNEITDIADWHRERFEMMRRKRDELAAAYALIVKKVLAETSTTKECPQWTTVDFDYMVASIRATLSLTGYKSILAAHDAALTKPLLDALYQIEALSDCYSTVQAAIAINAIKAHGGPSCH
jgi:hypothetical protein